MMKYIGIDLGTTNSAIASFDGKSVAIHKSPEQQDVTPSAIYVNPKRGQRFVGRRAYDQASKSPDSVAMLFKRFMGTSTPIVLRSSDTTMTPEAASAEILQTLMGYLPEEVRGQDDIGTVITVPAAFNQMQKDATLEAAELADIGSVALMQEPVAAVMSVMQQESVQGTFLIFDLGGGTLDVAIAESLGGRVNLLSHGGVAMLGGRDLDRAMFNSIVKPWLFSNFHLPPNLMDDPKYRAVARMASWAAERAKVSLSQRETEMISLSEDEFRAEDLDGQEIYLDIPITRKDLDSIIAPKAHDAVVAAREAISEAGYSPTDLEQIVFVGGPTQYKPLRDLISFELGIAAPIDVNPMTAVATGAAIYAESIDWASSTRGRKSSAGKLQASGQVHFAYSERTPLAEAVITSSIDGVGNGEFAVEFTSETTGWNSGVLQLKHGSVFKLPLGDLGEHRFRVRVTGLTADTVDGAPRSIVITRTAASVDGIPAAQSIGVEAKTKAGGTPTLDYLVRSGDSLPMSGSKTFVAETSVLAGSDDSLVFRLWEGEIDHPVTDNRPIGMFEVKGTDFTDGRIMPNAEVTLEYTVMDSGNIDLQVTVPSISGTFQNEASLYARQAGQLNFETAQSLVQEEARAIRYRVETLEGQVSDERLDRARSKLEEAQSVRLAEADAEEINYSQEQLQEVKRILSTVKSDHRSIVLRSELQALVEEFDARARDSASSSEQASFDNLARTAQRAIEAGSPDAESYLDTLQQRTFLVLWHQDWFVQDYFEYQTSIPWAYSDPEKFRALVREGDEAIARRDFVSLRRVLYHLTNLRIAISYDHDADVLSNIIRSG